MEIRQIYYALEIAKCRSFSAAARNLYITQPAITHQIKALEEELQVCLFKRSTHGVEVTPDGHKFCEYAMKVIESVDELRSAFHLGGPDDFPLLQIGVFPFYGSSPLQHILSTFFASNYKVVGNLKTVDNYEAFNLLGAGDLDFAIIKIREENIPSNISYVTLNRENIYALLKRDEKLIKGGTLTMQELGKFPLLTGETDSHYYKEMQDLYEKNNIPFQRSFLNTKETALMVEMVKNGFGTLLATEHVARSLESDEIMALRIVPNQTFETILAFPQNRKFSGIYLTFKNYVMDQYRDVSAIPRGMKEDL
jgi:LysR family transcriptional regulator, hydrogen peroxide-inducible genes activator